MPRVLRIGIVGAGLAGLAAAVAASGAGVEVDVFEANDGVADLPAHIDVVPNMLRDLATLGVVDACVRRGFAYRDAAVMDAAGRLVLSLATPALAGPRLPAALGMIQTDLLQVLHDEALARGARLHWKCRIEQIHPHQTVPRVVSATGMEWSGDLIVVAGASEVKGIPLPLAANEHRMPQRWDHVLLPRLPGIQRSTWLIGFDRAKASIVPVGVARTGVAVMHDEQTQRAPGNCTVADLRASFSSQGGLMAELAPLIRGDARVVALPVRSGHLAGAWHVGAALRIGSSAHLLPPHFGQAAAQSIEDAVVLGDLLRADIGRGPLLAAFMSRRADRAAKVGALATQAAQWHLNPEPSTDLLALASRLAELVKHSA